MGFFLMIDVEIKPRTRRNIPKRISNEQTIKFVAYDPTRQKKKIIPRS